MLGILILSYMQATCKTVAKFLYFTLLFNLQNCLYLDRSATRYPIEMEFGSKCSILNGQLIFIEKSKLK